MKKELAQMCWTHKNNQASLSITSKLSEVI